MREDSLQLPRPEPAVQQQARHLRVTTACIHNYGFKQIRPASSPSEGTAAPAESAAVSSALKGPAARAYSAAASAARSPVNGPCLMYPSLPVVSPDSSSVLLTSYAAKHSFGRASLGSSTSCSLEVCQSPFGAASNARLGKPAWSPSHSLVFHTHPSEMVVIEL